MPSLRFTPVAARDLNDIGNYIGRDNPERAKSFIEAIIASCRSLLTTPYMGPERPDVGPGIRAMIVRRNYAVLYRLEDDDIQIIRVVHTARDIRRVLKPDS